MKINLKIHFLEIKIMLLFLSDCKIKGKSNACVFPFQYRGHTYHKCTYVDSREAWCAFDIDPYTVVTDKYHLREDCEEDCLKEGKLQLIKSL